DTLLIYIVTRKLDQRTYREWEECKGSLDKTSPIAFEVFMQFLRSRADLIETLELSRTNYSQAVIKTGPKIKSMVATQSPTSSISELTSKLNTVTYGTASAPFLATRCLKQIGLECRDPKISEIIIHDFYVDDLLTGGRDLDEVRFIRAEVTKALASACMPLRKWRSNDPQLVSDAVPQSFHLNIGSDEPDKLLGLGWHVNSDDLGFPIGFTKSTNGYTKRDLLSVIARIFDPMGLLCPIVVTMKVLLQRMWLDKLSWDQPLPSTICKQWDRITKQLPLINNLRIPRIVVCDLYRWIEIHVFTDASESEPSQHDG
ncbi:hypothetical protein HF086_011226, partial [Spodoptera exigua]